MRTASTPKLNDLLSGYLAGDQASLDHFPKSSRPYLLKLARRLAPDLPVDIQEEVVQQTLLNLLSTAPRFEPQRGSAGTYLGLAVRTAARQVRSAYAPAGCQKRRRASAADEKKLTAAFAEHPVDDVEQLPGVTTEMDQVDTAHDADAVLALAPPAVKRALVQLFMLERPMNEVSAELNLSRFSLGRRVDAFAAQMRAAA